MRSSARYLPAFPEEWLCRVWERPDLLRQPFRTLDGRTVRILDPGTGNSVDGPDFLDATIEEDGTLRRGAVEFHFRTSDWYAHRHHTDPRYNGVILHVVLTTRSQTCTSTLRTRGARPSWSCARTCEYL